MKISTVLKNALAFIIALAFVLPLSGQDVDVSAGKELFRNNCASCHNKDMKSKLTGPALGGTQERWADYPQEDLYTWIRNSQSMVNTHPRGKELWAEWGPVVMTTFGTLTDQDIANILGYIDHVYTGADQAAAGGGAVVAGGDQGNQTQDRTWLYVLMALVLLVLAGVLSSISQSLKEGIDLKTKGEGTAPKPLSAFYWNKGVVGFIIFAIGLFVVYKTVSDSVMLGRQMGYQPEQPINFSHAKHAGEQGIDCKFCHDGARRSKHSVIPSANTCMLCHKAVTYGSTYGTAELTKIYASIGYNPLEGKYIENYESLSQAEVEEIYKKWIEDQHVVNDGSPAQATLIADKQWGDIVEALTDPESGDNKVQGPIEWVRIHNLPDHVYFNHSQHVTVGGLECQTCHGPVEEMEVLEQHAPLSMGWCVNCHRQTKVAAFENNPYYESYAKYHQEIADGKRKGVTVEEIGGLECQKCHY